VLDACGSPLEAAPIERAAATHPIHRPGRLVLTNNAVR